jgi:ubiquinone/menaquinone biosynthesis C-methylase UbiE
MMAKQEDGSSIKRLVPHMDARFNGENGAADAARSILGPDRMATARILADVRPMAQVRAEWNAVADTYVQDYRSKKDTANALIEMPFFMALLNGNVTDANILDVGTGSGWLINKLFAYGEPAKVTGIDISERMLKYAQYFVKDKPYAAQVELRHRPIEQSGFQDESFDVMTSFYVLDAVPDLRKALREMNRMLTPGGWNYALIKDPGRNRLYAMAGTGEYHPGYNSWYHEIWPGTGDMGVWARYMDLDQWINEFNDAGFQTYVNPIKLSENRALDDSLKRKYPELRGQYISRPSGLVIAAQKFREAS